MCLDVLYYKNGDVHILHGFFYAFLVAAAWLFANAIWRATVQILFSIEYFTLSNCSNLNSVHDPTISVPYVDFFCEKERGGDFL